MQPLPDANHRCWLTLACGGYARLQTKQLGLQLLFKKLQGDPLPPERKAAMIREYFMKFSAILKAEISQLPAL